MTAIATHELFFAPLDISHELEKAGSKAANMVKNGQGPIRGIVTSERVDLDGERVHQDGLVWDVFKSSGVFTIEHPLGVFNSIGEPTRIEKGVKAPSGAIGTLVEGFLWLHDKLGRAVFQKALSMAKSGSRRQIGMSIEGDPLEVSENGVDILKAMVRSVAISMAHRNLDAGLAPMMKARLNEDARRSWGCEIATSAGILTPGMEKAGVGYPSQGVPSVGEVGTLVSQDIMGGGSGVVGNVSSQRSRLAQCFSVEELLTARVLQRYPGITWAQGKEITATAIQRIGN